MKRLWKAGYILLCNISILIVLLVLFEYAVRWLYPQQLTIWDNKIWRPDSLYAWSHHPWVNTKINAGERTVSFLTDDKGYRIGKNKDPERDERAGYKILGIGDSFIEAIQVEHESSTTELLREKFRIRHHIGVYVANTGVSGWAPQQYYLLAREELKKENYDLGIVFLYAGNDFILNSFDTILKPRTPRWASSQPFSIPFSMNKNVWMQQVIFPINNWLERESHLYVLSRYAFRKLFVKQKPADTTPYFPDIFFKDAEKKPVWDLTAKICERINALFAAKNIPCLFVLIPADYQVDDELFTEYLRILKFDKNKMDAGLPNKVFAQKMREAGLPLLDPLPVFIHKRKKGGQLYSKIHKHLNEEGHKALAEYLWSYVDEVYSSQKRPTR